MSVSFGVSSQPGCLSAGNHRPSISYSAARGIVPIASLMILQHAYTADSCDAVVVVTLTPAFRRVIVRSRPCSNIAWKVRFLASLPGGVSVALIVLRTLDIWAFSCFDSRPDD